MFTIWSGDFNTLPCSPLYNFIRYSSIKDLKRYAIENWSGQTSGLKLHDEFKDKSVDQRLKLLGESFDCEKHGKHLKDQQDHQFLDKLYESLHYISVELAPGKVKIVKGDQLRKAEPMKLKSAFAEDFALRNKENTKVSAMLGEMEFSTIPKQNPHPVTTDYVL